MKMAELSDPSLSLREKWRIHMERKRKRVGSWDNPVFFHKSGPITFLFVFVGAGGWGAFVAIPTLYRGGWEDYILPSQTFVAFILLEVLTNWCLTRWVDSEYKPDVHGTKPDEASEHSAVHCDNETPREHSLADSAHNETNSFEKYGRADDSGAACVKRGNAKGKATKLDSESEAVEPDDAPPVKHGAHDGYSYRMLVATSLPKEDGHVERKSVPYWSWVKCVICQRLRPPRCHHCVLCKCCILKRDHHCYLTGACIGLNNQRHFIVFLVYAVVGCVFGTAHMLPYTFLHVVPEYQISYFDFLPPVSLARGLLGYISLVVVVLCLEFWLLLLFTMFTVFMLVGFLFLLYSGQTTFERDSRIKLTDTRSLHGRLRSVFGDPWWLNFLPVVWAKPVEDAVLWPDIKP